VARIWAVRVGTDAYPRHSKADTERSERVGDVGFYCFSSGTSRCRLHNDLRQTSFLLGNESNSSTSNRWQRKCWKDRRIGWPATTQAAPHAPSPEVPSSLLRGWSSLPKLFPCSTPVGRVQRSLSFRETAAPRPAPWNEARRAVPFPDGQRPVTVASRETKSGSEGDQEGRRSAIPKATAHHSVKHESGS